MEINASITKVGTKANPSDLFTLEDRSLYLLTAVTATGMLAIARILTPSTTGVGTHQQLGLPACPFLHLTGLPCPTCGFTTSFAYGARFQFMDAFLANPAGFVCFCLTIISIPISLFLLQRRVAWTSLVRRREVGIIVYGFIVLLLLSWLYKIFVIKSIIPL